MQRHGKGHDAGYQESAGSQDRRGQRPRLLDLVQRLFDRVDRVDRVSVDTLVKSNLAGAWLKVTAGRLGKPTGNPKAKSLTAAQRGFGIGALYAH